MGDWVLFYANPIFSGFQQMFFYIPGSSVSYLRRGGGRATGSFSPCRDLPEERPANLPSLPDDWQPRNWVAMLVALGGSVPPRRT